MTFSASRDVAAPPHDVFAAFTDIERVSRFWGTDDFNATFTEFALQPGARWVLSLHARGGGAWSNELRVVAVEPHRIELESLTIPRYSVIIALEPISTGTRVSLLQTFENAAQAEAMRHLIDPSNAQLLARLETEAISHRTP
ncbi:MAG: SRPBCC domain-containing protein [Archangium sp.]